MTARIHGLLLVALLFAAGMLIGLHAGCQKVQAVCPAVDLAYSVCHSVMFQVPPEAPAAPDAGSELVAVPRDEQLAFVRSYRRRQRAHGDAGAP
jgi:hypothetical protein